MLSYHKLSFGWFIFSPTFSQKAEKLIPEDQWWDWDEEKRVQFNLPFFSLTFLCLSNFLSLFFLFYWMSTHVYEEMSDEINGWPGPGERVEGWCVAVLVSWTLRFYIITLSVSLGNRSSSPTLEVYLYFRLVFRIPHIQRWRDHAVAIPCSALRAELFAFAWRKSWTDRPNCSNHGNFPQEVRASTGRERGPRLLLLFSFLMIEVFFFAILNGLWMVFLLLFFFFNNYDRHWKSGICVHFPQS